MLNKDWSNLDNTNMKDAIDQLYAESNIPLLDDTEEELDTPTLILNLDDINNNAKAEATEITERLSNYYFDERYVTEHPYIKNKIQSNLYFR